MVHHPPYVVSAVKVQTFRYSSLPRSTVTAGSGTENNRKACRSLTRQPLKGDEPHSYHSWISEISLQIEDSTAKT